MTIHPIPHKNTLNSFLFLGTHKNTAQLEIISAVFCVVAFPEPHIHPAHTAQTLSLYTVNVNLSAVAGVRSQNSP